MNRQPLLTISSLKVELPDRILFDKLALSVFRGQVLALIGANGCGKSTLLRLIESAGDPTKHGASDEAKVTGDLHLKPGLKLLHLPQRIEPFLKARDGSSDSAAMSDGERQKRALRLALADRADLFLFDEPTNYLDIDGIIECESAITALVERGAGIVIVSHDRRLINNLADQTVYFTPHGVFRTAGGYSSASDLAESELESRRHSAGVIRSKITRLETEARSRMQWAASKEKSKRGAKSEKPHIAKMAAKMAARAKAAQKKAEAEIRRLEETKPFVSKPVRLRLPEYEVRTRNVVSLEEVSFEYENSPSGDGGCLSGATLGLSTSDRVCLMGSNGSGKSTLLKLIAGELRPSAGRVRRNKNVRVSYLPQGLRGLFPGRTLLEGFADVSADEATIRTLLGGVMIRRDRVHQPLDTLSPGELTRAAVVKAMVDRAEFLLLDEPTSHLDIESVELLEKTLAKFPGGFLVVSHDRSFVERVAERLYRMKDGHPVLV